MIKPDTSIQPEREETDESLRTEREKTDQEFLLAKKRVEQEADLVVLRAREKADAVLSTAREKADDFVSEERSDSTSSAHMSESRDLEDSVLQKERAAADLIVDREREKVNLALKRLFPLEREATDRTLITERARSDTALENRDDFLGMVCHDLRDLLGGIVLNAELLAQQAPASVEETDASTSVIRIQRYAARMNRLIGDLVDVASIDAGKLLMVPTRGNTSLLMTDALDAFTPAADAKNIVLEIDDENAPIWAQFDHDRMLQVFANLLANAIKFSPPGSTITLRREKKATELLFTVTDTGPGIPETMREAVFDRFWQAGKNDRRGLGLGLYISKCIVEAHGGKIWVEGVSGEGSTFCFTLPTTD